MQYQFINLDLLQKMKSLKQLTKHTTLTTMSNKIRKRSFHQQIWLFIFLFPIELFGATNSNELLTVACHCIYICWKTFVFLYYIKEAIPLYRNNTLWMVLDARCVHNEHVVENAKRMYSNLPILPLVKKYFPLEIVAIIVSYVSEDLYQKQK
eukprot:UN13140